MPEIAEKDLTLRDYTAVLKRRSTLFFWVTAPVLTLGIALAFGLPAVYQSSAILLAEQQEVPEYLVQSTVPGLPDQRVRLITQRVMTEQNLVRIMEENDLYPELRALEGREALREMRSNLTLGAVDPLVLEGLIGNSEEAVAFTVAFQHGTAETAYDVARELVSLYLGENQRAREELATETMQFLAQEAGRLEREIATKEVELAEFKRTYSTSLPELSDMNLALMDRTERDLEAVEREIRLLRASQALLETELTQLSPYAIITDELGNPVLSPQDRLKLLQRSYVQLSAVYSQDHPDVLKTMREIEALSNQTGLPGIDRGTLQTELMAREAELAAARERYSPDYPDVARLERTVENLRAALDEAPSRPTRSVPTAPPDNPLYIQKQAQLEGSRVDLQAELRRRGELRQRLNDLEDRLTRAPEVERQYVSLTRGYEQLVQQYNEVDAKQREAQIALNLEAQSKGERFTVLDSPDLPALPVSPNRIAILLLTIALALAAGAGSIALADVTDTTVRNTRDVTELLEIPPLVAIPYINNEADLRAKRLRRFMVTATVCLWVGVTAFFVVSPMIG